MGGTERETESGDGYRQKKKGRDLASIRLPPQKKKYPKMLRPAMGQLRPVPTPIPGLPTTRTGGPVGIGAGFGEDIHGSMAGRALPHLGGAPAGGVDGPRCAGPTPGPLTGLGVAAVHVVQLAGHGPVPPGADQRPVRMAGDPGGRGVLRLIGPPGLQLGPMLPPGSPVGGNTGGPGVAVEQGRFFGRGYDGVNGRGSR